MNEVGSRTNFLIFSLYLKSKVWVCFDVISSLNSSLTDNPCCWPVVVAVATVTVPFTLVASPVILLNNSSNLALSVEPVTICLKNTLLC